MAEHMQTAKRELLQHLQEMPSTLQSVWWTTNDGKQVYRRLEETYHQLASGMAEERGLFLDSDLDVEIAPTSPSSSLREEVAEDGKEAAGEEQMFEEEVTGEKTFCERTRTPT